MTTFHSLANVEEAWGKLEAAGSPGPWQALEALGEHAETGEPFTSWVLREGSDKAEDIGEVWSEADAKLICIARKMFGEAIARMTEALWGNDDGCAAEKMRAFLQRLTAMLEGELGA